MQVALGKANDDPLSTLALLAVLREAVEVSVIRALPNEQQQQQRRRDPSQGV